MFVKITTPDEMCRKGWTIRKQIKYEAKELSEKYVLEALADLGNAILNVKTNALRESLTGSEVRNIVLREARKRALYEIAEKYRVKKEENADDHLGTLQEQPA